jgi:Zn-dependent protease with chaperone function
VNLLRGALFAMALLTIFPVGSATPLGRPNALDRRVDAISHAALLARPARVLVDPARQAAALRRAHWTLPGWLLIQLFEAAALFYLWSSGGAAALRDRLRRRIDSAWLMRFAFGAALAFIARLASFLPAFYLYRVDKTMGLSVELTRYWALSWAFYTVLGMIVAGLIAAIVLGWVGRTHQWYVYTILGILGGCIVWSYLSPFAYLPGSHPFRPRDGRIAAVPVRVESLRSSQTGEATVVGLGPSRTILLSDTLVAGSTEPEIEYQIAYELGHMAHRDLIAIALIQGAIIIVFAALAVVLADRIGFRRDDDSLSRLAIVGALLALVYLIAVPVRNAALRSYDFAADRYAVALTGDPAAAVRALVRASDQRMEEVCPELTARLFLYASPGVGARIAAINHVPSGCP